MLMLRAVILRALLRYIRALFPELTILGTLTEARVFSLSANEILPSGVN